MPRTTTRRALALLVLLACLVGTGVLVVTSLGNGEPGFHGAFGLALLGYPVVAAIVLWHRSHPVGYLLLLMGAVLAASNLLTPLVERPTPPGTTAAWGVLMAVAGTLFPLFAMLLPALGLRFPDGRPLSPRWRRVEWLYALGVASVVVSMLLTADIPGGEGGSDIRWTVANPLATPAWSEPVRRGLEVLAGVALFPAIPASIVAVVLRFRRSRGVERLQLRWLTFLLLAVLLSWPVAAGSAYLVAGDAGTAAVANLYSMLVVAVPPVGLGVAVMRYRLYDLDRIVSRTLAYALVTGLLASLYAGAVVGLGAVLRPLASGGGDLVVAMSTLLVAAAFRPLLQRVRSVVDRRFNRRRVDAARTIESFGQRLRDEVDLGELRADLQRTVHEAVAPSSVGLLVVRTDAST